MRQAALFLALVFVTATAFAQTNANLFSIGPRVSSFSTDLDDVNAFTTIKTGRASSFGLIGDVRASGGLVFDWRYDHDTSDGLSPIATIVDVSDFRRDSGEVTIGYELADIVDLQAGVRLDSFSVGGATFLGTNLVTDLDVDHQALAAGIKIHTPPGQRLGFYVLGRGYVGTAKFHDDSGRTDGDTSGYRGEAAVIIPLGESNWHLTPGVEYDHIETKNFGFRMNTNRFFLGFVYTSR